MNPNNLSQPSEMYGNSQSSGYESMPDYFYQDFPSQEMGPPPVPNRFQQQQPQMLTPQAPQSQQSMDHQSSQMGSNQGWHQSQQQPQQQPQQHFQQPQQQGEQEQQQPPQFQQPAAAPAPPPAQPQFRLQQQPSAPAPPKAQPATVTTQPQFVLNNQTATSSTSRSNTPIQVDKTRINVLRQQVLHPVDPKIVEKMHTIPPTKPKDNAAEMLLRMKDFESVIPDAAAKYIMSRSGTAVDDDICYRMLAISAQKFASDILSDAFNIARSRGLGQTNRATKETKYVLTHELVKEILSEHGIRSFSNN